MSSHLKILNLVGAHANEEEFVSFWKDQYEYPNMSWYTNNISASCLEYDNLHELFCWKNGMPLSNKKLVSFQKISTELNLINDLRKQFDENKYFEYNGFIVSAFITFALGIIPAGLVFWFVSLMLNGKNETKNTELDGCLLPGLIVLALIFGFIIKTALFQ